MSQTIDLTLDGLSCGHCVKRVKESLEQRPDVEQSLKRTLPGLPVQNS